MKITAFVIVFLFVQNLQVFSGDQPEKFESIILEKPWVIQFSLIDMNGISMRQSYNYTMNVGKYLSKNVLLRAGFNFGKNNENVDYNASSSGVNPSYSLQNIVSDTYIYGGTLDALYNFLPDKKLQISAGICVGYEYRSAESNNIANNSYGNTIISEKNHLDILRGGIAASINFFVHRQIGLYIENKIYLSNNKLTRNYVRNDEIGGYHSHDKLSSNNITFDNLLLGIGFYF